MSAVGARTGLPLFHELRVDMCTPSQSRKYQPKPLTKGCGPRRPYGVLSAFSNSASNSNPIQREQWYDWLVKIMLLTSCKAVKSSLCSILLSLRWSPLAQVYQTCERTIKAAETKETKRPEYDAHDFEMKFFKAGLPNTIFRVGIRSPNLLQHMSAAMLETCKQRKRPRASPEPRRFRGPW
jgi:hypothetical protein